MNELSLIQDYSKLSHYTVHQLEAVIKTLNIMILKHKLDNSWNNIALCAKFRMRVKLVESELVDRILIGEDDVQT